VVLLDLMMPDLNGFQVLERLKADERLHNVPVIMISGLQEVDSVIRCIEAGAADYLSKPFNPVLLRARISAASSANAGATCEAARHGRARMDRAVPSVCGFELGANSLPSGPMMRLPPPQRWSSKGFRLPTR
jgi:DNA-binding response OmpR family regulator